MHHREISLTWRPAGFGLLLPAAAAILLAGCATRAPSDWRRVQLTDNLQLYDLYDNSRDWGPSFLVGPPAHHWGDESRIDDTRLVPRVDSQDGTGGGAGPSAPPTPPMTKPLPPLP